MRDLRYAVRQLIVNPVFTGIAVLCLALGIGATTAVFTVVDAVVFRELPYAGSERLVRLYTEFPKFPGGGLLRFPASPPEFADMRAALTSFEHLDAWQVGGANLTTAGDPLRITAAQVTGTLFDSLGVQPERGRWIRPSDDAEGAPLAILISDGLWQRAFGRQPQTVGSQVRVNGMPATIVGIMPAGFAFPPGQAEPAEVWAPLQLTSADLRARANHRLNLLGKLRPNVTLAQARQEIQSRVNAWGARRSEAFHTLAPDNHPVRSFPMLEETVRNVRPAMLVVLGAVAFVLLIACVNVANLLLARAESRQKEISVRVAMGAGITGLVRQFFLEGLLLAAVGSITGMAIAFGGLRLLLWAGADAIPRASEVTIDWRVLLFTIAVLFCTAVAFGLVPLVQALAHDTHGALKSVSGRTSATRGANALRRGLVVAELALSLVLLVSSGLMIQAFWRLQSVDCGFQPHNLLTMSLALPQAQYASDPSIVSFLERLEERVASTPGVVSSTVMSGLPPQRPLNANDTEIENFVPRPGGPIQNVDYWQFVGHRFFETLGARLIEGRFLDERDGEKATPTAVVNETMARTFWPGQSALGRRFRLPLGPNQASPWITIVGVVADLKNAAPDRPAGTELFVPYRQVGGIRAVQLVIRTSGDPLQLTGAVRGRIHELDSSLPVASVRTMDDVIATTRSRPRFLSILLGFFTTVALVLSAVGVYGVISYSVARRTAEFGIRMAIGADRARILRMVLTQGFVLGAAGMLIGVAAALALTRYLRTLLYGIEPLDVATYVFTIAVLLLITVFSSWWPATRATRVDPASALRYE